MEIFFLEQADGTFHKMEMPDGVEKTIGNAKFIGKYKSIVIKNKTDEELEAIFDREDLEFFFLEPDETGIPKMIFAEPI